jgi:hypothetical protein
MQAVNRRVDCAQLVCSQRRSLNRYCGKHQAMKAMKVHTTIQVLHVVNKSFVQNNTYSFTQIHNATHTVIVCCQWLLCLATRCRHVNACNFWSASELMPKPTPAPSDPGKHIDMQYATFACGCARLSVSRCRVDAFRIKHCAGAGPPLVYREPMSRE